MSNQWDDEHDAPTIGRVFGRADSGDIADVSLPVLKQSIGNIHQISCETVRRLLDGEFQVSFAAVGFVEFPLFCGVVIHRL